VSFVESLDGVVLALDVDGVLLDSNRGGLGTWHNEVGKRFGVDAARLSPVFFRRVWRDIVVGSLPIEPALAEAIDELGWNMSVDELLDCWFEADFVVDGEVVDAVNRFAERGARLILATNQEHRRAAFLTERLGQLLPLDHVLYSGAVGAQKHEERFFADASNALGGIERRSVVAFIDDDATNVATAQAFGWTAEVFTKTTGWRERLDRLVERAWT
jgi:putative hydrolase of the HAD superfamily